VRALCEPVEPPRDDQAFYRYFSSAEHGNADQLKANEPQRLALYKLVAALVRAYANLASEMTEAGYSDAGAAAIKDEVTFYENLRSQVKLHSGDAIDLKQYEPAMRHLIDTYIRAEDSVKVSEFDDLSLVQLIVERGRGCRRRPAAVHPQEGEGGRGDHREQRPQAHHRRVADQPQVLREDVRAAGRADRAAQGRRARVPGVPGEGHRADPPGQGRPDGRRIPGDPEDQGAARAIRQPRPRRGPGA
jgi:hypothetical protein